MKKIFTVAGIVLIAMVVAVLGVMLGQANAKVAAIQADLNEKSAEVNVVQSELSQTNSQLTLANNVLLDTRNDLDKTNTELSEITINLTSVNAANSNLETRLTQAISDRDEAIRAADNMTGELNAAIAAKEEAISQAEEALASIALYRETFGEVFAGVEPMAIINDSMPVTFNMPIPQTPAPVRGFNLINNPDAVDPTYAELLSFLISDITDSYRYVTDYYMCGNFAETVHNNAEAAGIRAALVLITFDVPPGHAINAFLTTDRGLVYIDCTGTDRPGPSSMDGIVYNLKIYSTYNREFLFETAYYFETDAKRVIDLKIYW
ncbi:MAG: hypothetical protein WC370_00890 [Dehalococcoidales bacterium]|jgi:uncharacterized protein YoxC